MTKIDKKNLKHKAFKISAIFSFVLNALFILFLILGLVGSNNVQQTKAENEPTYTDIQAQLVPVQREYSFNLSYDLDNYNFNRSDKLFFNGSGSFTLYLERTFVRYYDCTELSISYNGDSSCIFSFVLRDGRSLSLAYQPTINDTLLISDFNTFTNSLYTIDEAFFIDYLNVFNGGYFSYEEAKTFVLIPFSYVGDFVRGIKYPINCEYVYYSPNNNRFYTVEAKYILFDYDNKVYTINSSNVKRHIANIGVDVNGLAYLDFYNSTSTLYNDNFLGFSGFSSNLSYIKDFFINNSFNVFGDLSNSGSIYFSGNYFLNSQMYIARADLYNRTNFGKIINVPYRVNGATSSYTDLNFTDYSNSSNSHHTGFIKLTATNVSQQIFYWDVDVIDLANLSDYYKGYEYGFNLAYPYYFSLTFDSYINLNDYIFLSSYLTPVSVYVPVTPGGGGDLGNTLDNIFTLFSYTFNSVNDVLSINIFPGISLWTLLLLPFFVLLIVAIIKLIKG